MVTRPGTGEHPDPPSRFLTEIDAGLYERADVESDNDLAWTDGPRG